MCNERDFAVLADLLNDYITEVGEPKINFTPEESERFWSKVDKGPHPNGCWLWTAGTDEDGYGVYVHRRQKSVATRIAYRACKGEIPVGDMICHSCDTPRCVNPLHLTADTHTENQRQKWLRGRGNAPKGEDHYSHELTDRQIGEIREMGAARIMSHAAIAARFAVSQTHVSRVIKGVSRKNSLAATPAPTKRICDKLNESQKQQIVALCIEGRLLHKQIADMFGVSRANVSLIWVAYRKSEGLKRKRTAPTEGAILS